MVSIDNSKLILEAFQKELSQPQYIRQIANNCKLSYERVQHYLKELEKIKVLRSKTKGKIKEYTLNKKHELVLKIFSILELEKRQLFYSRNPQFQSWLVTLVQDFTKNSAGRNADVLFILLFGSTAREDAKSDSDVDILIVVRSINQTFNDNLAQIKAKLETLSGKVFSLHSIDYKEFISKWEKEPIYAAIWLDHIMLYGEENFLREALEMGEPIVATVDQLILAAEGLG